jgi:VWFA-related protein
VPPRAEARAPRHTTPESRLFGNTFETGEGVPPMFKKVIALLAFATAAVAQQPPQFGEKVDVNLVTLDAIVTDSKGNQILGLDKEDFVVVENGNRQNLDSVEYFTNRKLLTSPEHQAAFKVERLRDDRYYIFFFDKPPEGQLFDRLALARRAAKEFVDTRMKPGDVVAIVAHDVRLKVFSDFTNDKAKLKRAIDESATFARGLTSSSGEGPSILRRLSADEIVNETGTVYQALNALGDALKPIHARKELILFSAGVVEMGEEVRGSMVVGESRFYQPMIMALNQADIAVYPINLLDSPNQPTYVHQTLSRIAAETNGEYFRFNTSFSPAVKRIENMTNGYYLLTYYTKRNADAHGFQKVGVKTRNPEFRVRARQGYSLD